MSNSICTAPPVPVVVVATHEELLRSARDMWAVTVSLLTELTPDKFATAPWAAALFTAELPFILAKLWHIQQGLIVAAHSYMETESMLTTFIETIDITKILKELATWAIPINQSDNLPFGITQHVPPVEIMQPRDVNIIRQRFDETNWSGQQLVRHETYQLENHQEHWFYLPNGFDWQLNQGEARVSAISSGLANLIDQQKVGGNLIHFIAEVDGELIHPELNSNELSGKVSIYRLEQL